MLRNVKKHEMKLNSVFFHKEVGGMVGSYVFYV